MDPLRELLGQREDRQRWALTTLLCAALTLGILPSQFGLATLGVTPAVAQEEEKAAEEEAPPADDPAPEAADDTSEEEDAAPQRVNFLAYVFNASPTFFVIMLVSSVVLLILIVTNILTLRLPSIVPPEMTANLDALLAENNLRGAYESLQGDSSLFSRSLLAALERINHGYNHALDAMLNVAEDGKLEMEHRVSWIGTIGSVAPMVGLFGTVRGMILAFQDLSMGGQPKPAELADKIGLALVTTLEGLLLAVPAILFYGFLRNRIGRLTYEVESLGEAYLWKFQTAMRKKQ